MERRHVRLEGSAKFKNLALSPGRRKPSKNKSVQDKK